MRFLEGRHLAFDNKLDFTTANPAIHFTKTLIQSRRLLSVSSLQKSNLNVT